MSFGLSSWELGVPWPSRRKRQFPGWERRSRYRWHRNCNGTNKQANTTLVEFSYQKKIGWQRYEMNRINGQPVQIFILFNVFQTYLKSDYFLSPIVKICACWQKHCDDMLVLWSSSPPSSVHTRRALRIGISCSRLVTNSRGILSNFVNEKSSGMKISIYRCASYWRVVLL